MYTRPSGLFEMPGRSCFGGGPYNKRLFVLRCVKKTKLQFHPIMAWQVIKPENYKISEALGQTRKFRFRVAIHQTSFNCHMSSNAKVARILLYTHSQIYDDWQQYKDGLNDAGITWIKGTWRPVHGDCKSSTGTFKGWAMRDSNGELRVKLEYEDRILFHEGVMEVPFKADYDSEVDRLKELRRTKPEKRTKEQKMEIEKLYVSIKTEECRQERLQTQEAVKAFHRGMEVYLTDLLLTGETEIPPKLALLLK
jgi:hypothetical protein